MALSQWSKTAASNATITDGTLGNINHAEGQAPNTVNDSARAEMAHVRAFYENIEWRDWGHTPVRIDATNFYVAGSDETDVYTVGRRVRIVDGTSGTIYGVITVTDYNNTRAGDTTVTVDFDSTEMAGTLTVAAVAFDPTNKPLSFAAFPTGTAGYMLRSDGTDTAWTQPVYGIRAYRGTNQSHGTSNTHVAVVFDTETYDHGTAINASTGLISVPTGYTWYKVNCTVEFAANTTGYRSLALATTTDSSGSTRFERGDTNNAATGGLTTRLNINTGWIPSSVASSFYVMAFQNSGGALNMLADQTKLYVEFR